LIFTGEISLITVAQNPVKYYAKVERLLSAAATQEDAVAIFSYIGSELQKGTFMSTP
jgi:hypothetical protein